MARHATRAKCLRRLGEVYLGFASRLLDVAKRDAGRKRVSRDAMFAAVRVYLRFEFGQLSMSLRVLVAEVVVTAARLGEVHAAVEGSRVRRLTGARVVLGILAVLRYQAAAHAVSVARAAARVLRACKAILAHALSQSDPAPACRSTAGRRAH